MVPFYGKTYSILNILILLDAVPLQDWVFELQSNSSYIYLSVMTHCLISYSYDIIVTNKIYSWDTV